MQVRIKPTGDEEIDRYIGRVGEVVKVEPPTREVIALGDNVTHYHVQMPDGVTVVINQSEFEVAE